MTRITLEIAINEGISLLKEACARPYNESIYLMMTCLNTSMESIILNFTTTLSHDNYKNFHNLLNRRLNREPIAYIRGYQEFWKHNFKVNSYTLIPRSDSETLISTVLKHNLISNPKILDLGTGSGCLLLSLLKEIQESIGIGIDISEGAIKVARENAFDLNLLDRVSFKNISWEELPEEQFDIVISNPPYIKNSDLPKLQKELSFEPINALTSGEDGLECYRSILKKLPFIIHKNSLIAFEFGQNQEHELLPLISSDYQIIAMDKDLSGIVRTIIFKQKEH